jgi:hypothetical protein
MIVAEIAILRARKNFPELAWVSIAVFLISWGSGPDQGIHRYVLAAPALFVQLGAWGKHPTFDRVWTIASLLLMVLLATVFAFDFWVA